MSATTTVITPPTPPAAMAARVAEWGPVIVSVIVLFVFVAAIIVAWQTKDPSLGILLGMAGANAGTAVGFWLGSSKGSQSKDATIATLATAPTPPGSTTTTTVPASATTIVQPAPIPVTAIGTAP